MSLELIRKHKKSLLSLAMLWMAIRHMYLPITFKPFSFLLANCGHGSIDMILFIIGFNLFYKYKDKCEYIVFVKNEILTLMKYPIPFFIVLFVIGKTNIVETFFYMIGASIFYRSDLSYWLVSFLIVLYVLFPIYLKIFKKSPFVVTALCSLLLVFVCLMFKEYRFFYIYFRTIIFVLGIYIAYLCDNKSEYFNKKLNVFLVITMIIGWILIFYLYHYVRNDIMHIYPFVLIIPGLCLLLSNIVEKVYIIHKPLLVFSKNIVFFYLIHEDVIKILYEHYGELFIPGIGFDWWINIGGFVIASVLSCVLTKMVDYIFKIVKIDKLCH